MAGAVGSTALGSHFGASLADHGPNVVLYRAGPQTARRAGSLRGHDHSRQSSSSPKPLRKLFGGPEEWGVALKSLAPGGSGGVAAPLFGTPGR